MRMPRQSSTGRLPVKLVLNSRPKNPNGPLPLFETTNLTSSGISKDRRCRFKTVRSSRNRTGRFSLSISKGQPDNRKPISSLINPIKQGSIRCKDRGNRGNGLHNLSMETINSSVQPISLIITITVADSPGRAGRPDRQIRHKGRGLAASLRLEHNPIVLPIKISARITSGRAKTVRRKASRGHGRSKRMQDRPDKALPARSAHTIQISKANNATIDLPQASNPTVSVRQDSKTRIGETLINAAERIISHSRTDNISAADSRLLRRGLSRRDRKLLNLAVNQ